MEITKWTVNWYFDGELIRQAPKFWSLLGQPLSGSCNSLPAGTYQKDLIFPTVDNNRWFAPKLNLAIHYDDEYNDDDIASFLPAEMLIDYIRIFKKEPSVSDGNVCATEFECNQDFCTGSYQELQITSIQNIAFVEVVDHSEGVTIHNVSNDVVTYSAAVLSLV